MKDADTFKNAFAVRPDILQDTVWGEDHPNFSDLGLQLSRSVRALKVWMSIQTFGMAAFRAAVSDGMELAARADERVCPCESGSGDAQHRVAGNRVLPG